LAAEPHPVVASAKICR